MVILFQRQSFFEICRLIFEPFSTDFQGLFQRDDNQGVINIPLGIIPAGSGNGLARSLAHINKEKYDKGRGFTLYGFTFNVQPYYCI